jgi:CheY-like chemotaxis protein
MALDKVRETYKNGKKYDIILMDIQMPVMNGKEATKILRQEGYIMPIIVQSSYTNEYSEEELLDIGFSDYLTKPIKRELLFRTINKQLDTVFSANLVNKEPSTKIDIREKIYTVLKEYEDSNVELRPSAINNLLNDELSRLHLFLQKIPERTGQSTERPERINYGHTGGVSLYNYKKELTNYKKS